jgi:hypothetical protein
MMGTLAAVLAGKKIPTHRDLYWADVEGDIENVGNVLKITRIRVKYHLKTSREKTGSAREAFSVYLSSCPAAQSVLGCIDIIDDLLIEEMERRTE